MQKKQTDQEEKKKTPTLLETVIFTAIVLVGMLLTAGIAKLLRLDQDTTLIIEIIAFVVVVLGGNYLSKILAKKLD
ncbi:hypothetical protein [Schleiferilactobacillus harbinensis]|uniref:hypothetical protein n=1 Tax=Schleiferilactobacillus harbinensis TaxID=304207 RepID=UPI00345E22B4